MEISAFGPLVRVSAFAAFGVCACATAKPAAPAKAAPASSHDAAPNASAQSAAVPSPAADSASPASVPMPAGALNRTGGTVISVDSAARTITIKDYAGRTRTFRLADGVKVTKGGDDAAARLSDLAAGDRVRLKVGGGVAAGVHIFVKAAL